MAWYSVVVIVMLVQQAAAQFNPDLEAECSAGPVYTFTITGQSSDGAIFIDGKCAQKPTTNGDGIYTFDEDDCTETLPPLGTAFIVRVLEYNTFGLGNDGIFSVTCSATETTVVKALDIETSDKEAVERSGTAVTPDLTDKTFVDGSEVNSGTAGQPAEIKFILSEDDRVEYGTKFASATATKTGFDGTVALITDGCTDNANVVSQPQLSDPVNGELTLEIILFIPIDTSSDTPTVVTPTTVTFTFEITICPENCVEAECNGGGRRRRRRADDNNSTVQTMEYAKTFTVYPTGHKKRQREEITKTGTAIDSSVCLARASFYGVISALLLVLVVCVAISACMFYRLRKGPVYKGSDTSYKNKAFY